MNKLSDIDHVINIMYTIKTPEGTDHLLLNWFNC